MSDDEIMAKLLEEDKEFQKVYFEHRELDEVIKNLESRNTMTLDELDVKKLKKIKLSLKDRMESRIRTSK